jgi:Mg2+-importing ATPase
MIDNASALTVEGTIAALHLDPAIGMTSQEARRRLIAAGPNAIPARHARAFRLLLRQFRSPLLLLLLGASVLSASLGDTNDAMIIGVIVLLSAGLGFANEFRAARAAEALRDQIQHTTVVRRDGHPLPLNVADVVPGDVVTLKLGDVVPADLRLIEVSELECDESVLTGEGAPVEKTTNPAPAGAALADLESCALAGTIVSSGSGVGVAVATGVHTKFGAIAAGLSSNEVETEFQRGLRTFSMFLVYVGGALTITIFAINVLLAKPLLDALLFSLAIAVGITPQLLPAVVSTSLAAGSSRLAKVKVLVKRLVCIEDLGDVSLVFTDKTGTLTRGSLDFDRAITASSAIDTTALVQWALLASESESSQGHAVGGNPLDQALWEAFGSAIPSLSAWHRLSVRPFDHERRMISVAVARPDGAHLLITKGAPESVLAGCTAVPEAARAALDDAFGQGSRVVAVATKDLTADRTAIGEDDERGLTLAGLLLFRDPPKVDARASLERLARLGIEVKVVTGDNPVVAAKVCHDLGLPDAPTVTGPEIAAMTDGQLGEAIQAATVFARVSPEDKARIVRVGRGLVGGVAFLGDGVNDALALHAADIGISVDSATDVAKDAADVILLEKDLGVLADGVMEGRRIFTNTIKYVMMGTSSNFGNMFSAAGASVFLPFLPMLPSQILLNNLLYDSGQLTIPTDHVDEEQLAKPSHWDIRFIRRFMLIFGPLSSAFDFVTFAVLLWVFHAGQALFQTGWFVESLATQALVIFLIRTRRIPCFRSRPSMPLLLSTLAVVLIGASLPLTPLGPLMHFTTLPPLLYVIILVEVIVYFGLVEFGKRLFYRSSGPPNAPTPSRPRRHHLNRRIAWFHGAATAQAAP